MPGLPFAAAEEGHATRGSGRRQRLCREFHGRWRIRAKQRSAKPPFVDHSGIYELARETSERLEVQEADLQTERRLPALDAIRAWSSRGWLPPEVSLLRSCGRKSGLWKQDAFGLAPNRQTVYLSSIQLEN